MGRGETLVGIEILDAKQVLNSGDIPSVVVEKLPATLISTNILS
jgi:hypothetical protein